MGPERLFIDGVWVAGRSSRAGCWAGDGERGSREVVEEAMGGLVLGEAGPRDSKGLRAGGNGPEVSAHGLGAPGD